MNKLGTTLVVYLALFAFFHFIVGSPLFVTVLFAILGSVLFTQLM